MILSPLQQRKLRLGKKDKGLLAAFAFSEIRELLSLIPTVEGYREKDELLLYGDNLLGAVMVTHASPSDVPPENMRDAMDLSELMGRERAIERAIEAVFEEKRSSRESVAGLLSSVRSIRDEFHRSRLLAGLLHYRDEIPKLPEESAALLAEHLLSELRRYLSLPMSEEIREAIELAADTARLLMNDAIASCLADCLRLEDGGIRYFALASLLPTERPVPDEAITALAHDPVYADMTHALLQQHGMLERFPKELCDPVYLAKSDLIHWLTYPTELGQVPDQIEYLGQIKKKEIYHVFRYLSYSDTLDDETRGKWLIGWSNDEGGTFSNFDLYEDFEGPTLEKTLKKIKKLL